MLKQKIIKKLKSRSGESLTEVLVAVLIGALSLALLATMVGSSQRMITNSSKSVSDYYAENNTLELQSGSKNGTVTLTSGTASVTEDVAFFINSETIKTANDTAVVSYTKK